MKLLVTRPEEDARPLTAQLEALGHQVVLDPLLEIKPLDAAPALGTVAALLFTSANGVRMLAGMAERRDLPVYVVGDHTAQAARNAGFAPVESAQGDADALVALVKTSRKPADGALLHVAGSGAVGNVAARLREAGFDADVATVYEAVPTASFASATSAALADGSLDGVILFSSRTARQFVMLMRQESMDAAKLDAWCLSPAVAAALDGLKLHRVHVAARPTQAALIETLKDEPVSDQPQAAPIVTPTPITPKPAPRRFHSGPAIVIIALLIVAAGVASHWWLPYVQPLFTRSHTAPPPEVVAAAPAVPTAPAAAPIETPATPPALADAAADTDTAAPSGDRLDRLDAAVADLGHRVDALQQNAADPQQIQQLVAQLGPLAQRLTNVEARLDQKQAEIRTDRALMLAAGQIETALQTSGPYDAPVAVIRAVAPDDKALADPLAVLETHAKTGVATRAVLEQELAALPAKLNAPGKLPEEAGFWQRLMARLQGLVSVRRIDDGADPQTGKPGPERAVANARADLRNGDLPGAITSMKTLDGAAAQTAQPWLDEATARQDAEQAAQSLEAILTGRLSTPSEAAP